MEVPSEIFFDSEDFKLFLDDLMDGFVVGATMSFEAFREICEKHDIDLLELYGDEDDL